MNDDNYITLTDEGIAEINPTASSDMQQAFIDTYRQTQGENTAQIGEAAHALGSDLPAQLGGLHGPSEYMKSRYQTPQTESRLAALRTAAQLSALNQLMQNDQNRWKNRYNQAYRSAQKRQRAKQNALYSNLGGGGGDKTTGGVDEIATDGSVEYSTSATNVPSLGFSNETYVDPDGHIVTRNMETGEKVYQDGKRVDSPTTTKTISHPALIPMADPVSWLIWGLTGGQ